jgi:hypothetical protein
MVRRASYLGGRKDRRDYPLSHGNFLGSGERRASPTIQGPSCSVFPNMLQDQRAGRSTSGRLFTREQISGTAPPNGILNFPYRNFALLWL